MQTTTDCCSCERFNLVENAWSAIADLDAPRSHHGLANLDGVVYLFGGYRLDAVTSDAPADSAILQFDATANTWVRLPRRLPSDLVDMTIVAVPQRRELFSRGMKLTPSLSFCFGKCAFQGTAFFISCYQISTSEVMLY